MKILSMNETIQVAAALASLCSHTGSSIGGTIGSGWTWPPTSHSKVTIFDSIYVYIDKIVDTSTGTGVFIDGIQSVFHQATPIAGSHAYRYMS